MINNNKDITRLRLLIRECLLLEDKRDVIINSVKLPDFVAEWAHEISPKFSVWIANDFKRRFLEGQVPEGPSGEIIKTNILKQLEAGNAAGGMVKLLRGAMRRFEGDYRHVADWLQGRNEGDAREIDRINLRELSFEEAMRRSDVWHEELSRIAAQRREEERVIEDEDGEVVKIYPDDFYWINLGTRSCEKEGRAMGHCGRGEGNLFSLRKEGRPFITADVMPNGTVRQLRGRANTKPKEEYHPYIKDFILSDLVDHFDYWDYQIENNFWLKDLGVEGAKSIIEAKPSLAENQNLDEILGVEGMAEMIRNGGTLGTREREVESNFTKEEFQRLYNIRPESFTSVYIHLKYGSPEIWEAVGLVSDNITNEGIKLFYDDWDDRDLIGLFKNDDEDLAAEIVSEDFHTEWNEYIFQTNLRDLEVPKINKDNLKNIIKLISKEIGIDKAKEVLEFKDSKKLVFDIQDKIIEMIIDKAKRN